MTADRRPLTRRAWLIGATAAAVALAGTVWLVQRPQTLATLTAQRQSVTLADGSQVDLNARTKLAVQMRGDTRHVRMQQGEAFFAVAKDAAKPFVIETPAGTVRVTGTAFNVFMADSQSLQVTVLEGSVAVDTGRGEQSLHPNEQLDFNGAKVSVREMSPAAAGDVTAWREGKVVFDDTPLGAALERFAAYHGRPVKVAPEVAGLPLGGRYTLDDFDQFLGSVEKTLPVSILRAEDGRVRVVAR